MIYCTVENSIIANRIVAEPEVAEQLGALPDYPSAEIGQLYASPPSQGEQLRADVDYLAVMAGVAL